MRHRGYKRSDMGHNHFLNSTCDIEENKRQRRATLPFLKMDMRPPIKGPQIEDHIISYNYLNHKVMGAVCISTDRSHIIL